MERRNWNAAHVGWACLGAAGAVCAALLYWFDPARSSFYPVCVFHQVTGWNCPGCGGLRAMHQLLHGHLAAAFELNALVVLGLPVAAVLGLGWMLKRIRHQPVRWELQAGWLWAGLALLLLFGVGRNL